MPTQPPCPRCLGSGRIETTTADNIMFRTYRPCRCDTPTTVVNIHHDTYDVYIGRGAQGCHLLNTCIGVKGWLGNPYPIEPHGRMRCIELFRKMFIQRLATDQAFKQAVDALAGLRLGCYCAPHACHGDTIKAYLETLCGSVDVTGPTNAGSSPD